MIEVRAAVLVTGGSVSIRSDSRLLLIVLPVSWYLIVRILLLLR